MPVQFDDELPEPLKLPRPGGWYELVCCSSIVLAIVAVVVVFALLR